MCDGAGWINVVGASYAAEHTSLDAGGKLLEIARTHADGTTDYHYALGTDGTKTTDTYDAAGRPASHVVVGPSDATETVAYAGGVKTSEVVRYAPGGTETSATKLYANVGGQAVLTGETQLHADGMKDVYSSNVAGRSYAATHDHYDAASRLTESTRTHADGTFDYHYVLGVDGTRTTDTYDAAGKPLLHAVVGPNGFTDTLAYTGGVLASEVVRYAPGGAETSATKLYTNVGGKAVLANDTQVHADGTKDVYLANLTGRTYTAEHDHYAAGSKLSFVDRTNADGSHAQTVYLTGQTLTSTAGAADTPRARVGTRSSSPPGSARTS